MGSVLSLLGAGGSILTMPILVYLFSIPAVEATSYSLLLVGLTALMGSIGYFRQGTIDIKISSSLRYSFYSWSAFSKTLFTSINSQ